MTPTPKFASDLAARIAAGFALPARIPSIFQSVPPTPPETGDLFVADIAHAATGLKLQSDLFREQNRYFPCIIPANASPDAPPIPVSIGLEAGTGASVQSDAGSAEDAAEQIRQQIFGQSASLNFVPVDEAIDYFQHGLTRFLQTRIQAANNSPGSGTPAAGTSGSGGGVPPPSGLPFQVDSKSSGLRIYYAPIYWHSNQQVLNALSRPVNDYIAAGRYHFGAALPGNTPVFDFTASYALPPNTFAYLAI
jgi:hypothetical protein